MTNKNIKAVVFDYGGVIKISGGGAHLFEDVAGIMGIPVDAFREEYFKHNHLSNVGNLSWEEMIIRVVSVFNTKKETRDKVLAAIKEFRSKETINRDILSLFPIIRRQGIAVAIFSNQSTRLREKLNANRIIKLVDEVIISGEIGFQKPHKDAFRVLFEKLKVRPEEVVFIDDTPESLQKAEEIGYTPILFKNNEQLKTDLRDFGINL